MSVSNMTVKSLYACDGSNKSFAIPFAFIEDEGGSSTKVYSVDADGVKTLQVSPTHFSFVPDTLNPVSVLFVTAPIVSVKILVEREMDIEQIGEYNNNGPFFAETHEENLDRLALMIQEVNDKVSRKLELNILDDGVIDPVLVNLSTPLATIILNEDGTGFKEGPTSTDLLAAEVNAEASAAAAASSAIAAAASAGSVSSSEAAAAASAASAAGSASAASTSATDASNSAADAAASAASVDISMLADGPLKIVSHAFTVSNIVDADVDAAAGIARSKLASGNNNRLVQNNGSGAMTDAAAITASRALASDANGIPVAATTTAAELEYVSGVTSAIQTQLDAKQAGDATLTALAAYNTNGLLTQTAADTFTGRTLTGTTDQISVANGSGVGGNPTVSLASNPIIPGTGSLFLPSGTTAQRPGSPLAGMIRYNSDISGYEGYKNGAWSPLGGGGAGGINFVGLTTAWAFTNTNDVDAEISVGNWVAFADAAASTPADLTGGSPATTITRTTTAGEVLNGTASLKITKSAANRQGEGVSCVFNVPPAYQGKPATIQIPFKILSGTLTAGDIGVWIYDVTNSVLITPFNNSLAGSTGTLNATFPTTASASTPANQQYRIGLYFASTSATAVTLAFDDVYVGPTNIPYGAVSIPAQSYIPTFTGFGSVTVQSFRFSQIADRYIVEGRFTVGTPTGVEARISLPTTCIAASDYTTLEIAGYTAVNHNANSNTVLIEPGASYLTFGTIDASHGGLVKANASTISTTGNVISLYASVRCQGLQSSSPLTQASTFTISNYLAAGTRVTGSAPTALGQYRSYLRNAGADTYTETNGNPTAVPSIADGIRIYNGGAFSSADTSNEPTRYEIFVGKNKNVAFKFFASAGNTGFIDVTPYYASGADVGYKTYYDRTTGIATVTAARQASGSATHASGINIDRGNINDPYFDIIVSEPAIPVQIGAPVYASYTGSATSISGSLATIVWATKVEDSHNAVSSGVFTAPSRGRYQINANIQVTGTIALNSQLDFQAQKNTVNIKEFQTYAGGAMTAQNGQLSFYVNLEATETLRFQVLSGATGPAIANSVKTFFDIVKVSE